MCLNCLPNIKIIFFTGSTLACDSEKPKKKKKEKEEKEKKRCVESFQSFAKVS